MNPTHDGLVLIDKPVGPTSHDIVAGLRRTAGQRRVGHAGTLDPMASGLLPVALGRATRLLRFLPSSPKVYTGRIRFGITTDTDDVTGRPRTHADVAPPDAADVERHAAAWVGDRMQVPPAVSAKKIDGERMYRLARRGVAVSPAPVAIRVERFRVTPTSRPDEWAFEVAVSPGTYVRALARDLGEALGCGAALAELRRTAIGDLRVEDALRFEPGAGVDEDRLRSAIVPIDAVPLALPRLVLESPEDERRFRDGLPVAAEETLPGDGDTRAGAPEGTLRDAAAAGESGFIRVERDGRLIGVGHVDGPRVRPRVVLP